MALSIKDPLTDQLARTVAKETGESITEAIQKALSERLERLQRCNQEPLLEEKLLDILRRVDALPVLDRRSEDEILGYDDQGLPRPW